MLIATRVTYATISNAPVSVYINNSGEYHHPYEKLKNNRHRFSGYLRVETENLDHILNLTSEKKQKKWEQCYGNPTGHEERLVLALRYDEIIIVPDCSNMLPSY